MKRKEFICICLILSLFTTHISAQLEGPLKNFPSPNAASLGLYGEVPISLYTGTPDISIPIHNLKVRGISVPIGINYHPFSVKPNHLPGWVGLGWNLFAGGCISRSVNGLPDEMKGSFEHGYFGHSGEMDRHDWTDLNPIIWMDKNYNKVENPFEVTPDEFSFNFCGYSGKFYMDHQEKWQVQSDQKIQVIFNKDQDCLSIDGLRESIRNKRTYYQAQGINNRFISNFTLITPDGYKYTFGGKDATEYSIPYYNQSCGLLVATSWFLTKITSPEGYSVDFTYIPGNCTVEIKRAYSALTRDNTVVYGPSKGNGGFFDGQLILPVYLQKIIVKDLKYSITFNSSSTSDLSSGNLWILKLDRPPGESPYYKDILQSQTIFIASPANLGWRKLNSISINANGVQKQINFKFRDNIGYRLRLDSLTEVSLTDNTQGMKYSFEYYGGTFPENLCSKKDDHWGFYNGRATDLPDNFEFDKFEEYHQPTPLINIATTEILKKINYPTGGSSLFEYDLQRYNQCVDNTNRLQTQRTDLLTGGVRLKGIYNLTNSGKIDNIRKFYYVKNFKNYSDTTNTGSGILASKPIYQTTVSETYKKKYHNYTIFNSGTLRPYSMSANGSHIGYSEVVEINFGSSNTPNGYKIYNFSNFDKDIWGQSHLDENPLFSARDDFYYGHFTREDDNLTFHRCTDKSIERGKLMSEKFYSSGNQLLKTVRYKYARLYNPEIKVIRFQDYLLESYYDDNYMKDLKFVLVRYWNAYRHYTSNFPMTQKEEITYSELSPDSIINLTTYSYENNLMRETTEKTSDNGSLITRYTYPFDHTELPICQSMVSQNIISVPISKTTQKKLGDGSFRLIKKELFNYDIQKNIFYLKSYQTAFRNESWLREQYRCEKIDARGNPVSVFYNNEPETIYLWTSYGLFPVFEIKNTTYSAVNVALGVSNCENYFFSKKYSANEKPLQINSIQEHLPSAQVRAFLFSAENQKIWEQDARGISLSYDYNPLGWLLYIKNHNKNILKSYKYGFSK